jgi:hypothetical protein
LPNQVIEFKSSARSKPQIVHVNRIRLFNHLEDSITNSDPTAQDIQQKIPSTQAKSATKHVRFSDDDEDEEDYIYDDNNIAGPIVQPQLQEPVPPPQVDPLPAAQPAPIQQGGANRLAEELFRRSTRSRGPVPDQDLPHRPMEYKKYTRK